MLEVDTTDAVLSNAELKSVSQQLSGIPLRRLTTVPECADVIGHAGLAFPN